MSAHDIGPLVGHFKIVLTRAKQLVGMLVSLAIGNRLNDATFFNQ
jgi:hypothetical protein